MHEIENRVKCGVHKFLTRGLYLRHEEGKGIRTQTGRRLEKGRSWRETVTGSARLAPVKRDALGKFPLRASKGGLALELEIC